MPRITAEALIPGVLTLIVVVSLVSVAQPTSALDTVVTGPDEVTKHDPIELTVVVSSTTGDPIEAQDYTLEISPADGDESLTITFAPDGTVLSTDPERGVVGKGEIRINRLLRDLTITPDEASGGNGYGYGYGYGYGDGPTTVTFDVVMPSSAFKHGEYTVAANVNTEDETGVAPSEEHSFTVQNPAGHVPPQDDDRVGDRGPNGPFGKLVQWALDFRWVHDSASAVSRVWIGLRAIVFGGF